MTNIEGLTPGITLREGKYRIEKVLGKGSFGITYLASAKIITQGNLGQMEVEAKVTIKEFFMGEINGREEGSSAVEGSTGSVFMNYRKKFRKEAENLSRLSHPNIVKVLDVFDENNTTYYVMEFLEGQNLDDYIKDKGSLDEKESISIIHEVGEALAYMHSKKMLHLDLKPKNIMRRHDGKYFLIDFGLSKQFTEDGEPESSTSIGLGTPGYSSIEQAEYKLDGSFPATLDVYALAATMYKMLTGKRPPDATAVLNDGFPIDSVRGKGISDNTIQALMKGMSPIRKHRYQTVRDFLEGLEDSEADESTVFDNDELKDAPKAETKPQSDPKAQTGSKPQTKSETKPKQPEVKPKQPEVKGAPQTKAHSKKLIYIIGGCCAAAIILCVLLSLPSNNSDSNTAGKDDMVKDAISQLNAEPDAYNNHDYVDLGLPSGLKWATCNVGASKPEGYGSYFAWGETSPKSSYDESNCATYDKDYDWLRSNGYIESSGNLTLAHDAARQNWGGVWRMPTATEIKELVDNTTSEWTDMNGVMGRLVTSKNNGKTIFLPAAGYRYGIDACDADTGGSYWGATRYEADACYLIFYSDYFRMGWYYRYYGQTVRPVAE